MRKIILAGGAGMVGRNLADLLASRQDVQLVVIDKHEARLAAMRERHPRLTAVCADLAEDSGWERHFEGAEAAVMLQAQISGPSGDLFIRNNNTTTERLLAAMRKYGVPYAVHASSSVVSSVAQDDYTRTKRRQEEQVTASGIACTILRPTLMFGPYDEKHLGHIAQVMRRLPVLPVPGDGRYIRQPLYAKDFCAVILHCLETRMEGVFPITGHENVFFIDCLRCMRSESGMRCLILPLPYALFDFLLRLWSHLNRHSVFTPDQLKAMVAGDVFEVIDWPSLFHVRATPFAQAMRETFGS